MFNQDIFDCQYLHFSSDEIRRSVQSDRWVKLRPRPIVLMIACDSGTIYLSKMPPNRAVLGQAQNDFLTPSGEALSIVSLIFHGVLENMGGRWQVVVNLGGSRFFFAVPKYADVGIVPSPTLRLTELPKYVEQYVRTHRHSCVNSVLLPA